MRHFPKQSNLYTDHLSIQNKDPFASRINRSSLKQINKNIHQLKTNYSITLSHNYAFLLLHLKSRPQTKNLLHVHIPEVAIFHDHAPYEVFYNKGGHIRGLKDTQNVRLSNVYSFFSQRSKERGYSKEVEQCVACFLDDQYLLLTDTDLFIACRKFRNDPFFRKLQYVRNKIKVEETNIRVTFDGNFDYRFRGEAMKIFLGHKTDEQFLKEHGSSQYLKFVCQKIALFLNYQQNIRITGADFIFSKGTNQKYYLMDVLRLEFNNLSDALARRELRLKQKDVQRMSKLIISEEQYEKLKHKQKKEEVVQLEKEMNDSFMNIAVKLNVQTQRFRFDQHNRTQQAFKKLFPLIQSKMEDTLVSLNAKSVHKVVLRTQISAEDSPKKTLRVSGNRRYYSHSKTKQIKAFK